jgi:hypothetical protein
MGISIKERVQTTIGDCSFEIILRDNRTTNKGICQVYNEAAANANGDILCFVHEDVAFKTYGWGENLELAFKETEKPGIIGIAGSRLIVSPQAGWYNFTNPDLNRYNVIQNYRNGTKKKLYINPEKENNSKVLLVDGVLMSMKKETWAEFPFNEQLLDGFHFYDIDISMRVSSKYNNYVTYAFEAEHLSEGSINEDWVKSFLIFDKVYPGRTTCLDRISTRDIRREKKSKLVHAINNLIKFDYPLNSIRKYFAKLFLIDPIKAVKLLYKSAIGRGEK